MAALGWMTALLAAGLAALTVMRLRAHAELVARACHELRSPLTAAGLAVHALGGGGPRRAPPRRTRPPRARPGDRVGRGSPPRRPPGRGAGAARRADRPRAPAPDRLRLGPRPPRSAAGQPRAVVAEAGALTDPGSRLTAARAPMTADPRGRSAP